MRVGICGGIGSGKSTVCDMFASCGAAVYSSDERAKALMEHDAELRRALVEAFGEECYGEGGLNRQFLAGEVFGCEERLALLNSIVHPAVRRDFEAWAEAQQSDYVILESAILFESGFDALVDCSVAVLAPRALRLQRAMSRDGASREAVEARMAAQMSDDELLARATFSIVNFELEDVQKDVAELNHRFVVMAKKEAHNE